MRIKNIAVRRSALAVVAAFAVLSPLALVNAASAANDPVLIRKVNTTDASKVELTVMKPPSTATNAAIKVSENGKAVTNLDIKTVTETNLPVGEVIVIDNSDNARDNDVLNKIKAAATAMVQAKQPNEQFAIVATQGTGRTVVPFTSNKDLLVAGIDNLTVGGQSSLWNAVNIGAGLLAGNKQLQPNIVVMAVGPDNLSSDSAFGSAESQLRLANAVAFTVAITGNAPVPSQQLAELTQSTGGRSLTTADASTTTQLLAGIGGAIGNQAVITYKSLGGNKLDISVGIGTGVATAHVGLGAIAEGESVSPEVVKSDKASFISGSVGLVLVAVISFLFVGLMIYGLIEVLGKERNQLTSALKPYQEGGYNPDEDEKLDFSKIADSEIIRKAVAATAKAAEERGLLQVVQKRLDQADLPLKPAEALFFTGAVAFVFMVIGAIFFSFIGIFGAALVFLAAPVITMDFLAKRRRKKFTSQLPDTLQLLAGTLRAGYSLVQGIDAVAKQCAAPMSTELSRALAEARLGRPIEESLQEISDRMGSADFEWAVMAIKIQREVGGNLAELLMTVSETMIGRERLRREVKGLTAEGRISAIVLSGLPFAIGILITVMNPTYMKPLLQDPLGQAALVGATLMIGIGYWLMNKMIEIEV